MQYDYIIIEAGMGGLSAANFLAKYNKKVLVLEKHNIPGGLVTSFSRKGVHFDLGIHGLYELKEGQAIPQFMEFWNAPQVETEELCGDLKCFIDGKAYDFQHGKVRESFLKQFPNNKDDVNHIFDIMETINTEMFSGTEAPEPPYDMNLFQLIKFGMNAKKLRPMFMKYGNKDAYKILDSCTTSDELKAAIYSKSPYPMVFMAFAYQWGVYGKNYYPLNGMQTIPDAAVKGLNRLGGELKLNTEVTEILIKDNQAYGVKTKDGTEYYGAVISNASPQFTFEWMTDGTAKEKMKKAISGKRIFEPVAALFLSLDENKYNLNNLEGICILSRKDYMMKTKEYTPETAPIVINIYPKREGDEFRALVALVPISYGYHNYWETEAGGNRGEKYKKLKKEVEEILMDRIGKHMGSDFIDAVSYHELSSPVTYERYTYSKNGSFMGWSVEQSEYGKYLKQRTDIKDLYLVGQWVFPGFGVAGVMASGYYLAKEILKSEGIDMKKDFTEYFTSDRL
jgi:phytoene dehydrogenase-like protein